MMATVHRIGNSYVYAIKGAPEMVLESSNLDEAARVEWATRVATLGAIGLRVLALGTRESQSSSDPAFVGLTFLGLVGLEDPPRQDVPEAIAACRAAGIRIVMMTGDHTVTARSIAGMVGLGGLTPYRRGRRTR